MRDGSVLLSRMVVTFSFERIKADQARHSGAQQISADQLPATNQQGYAMTKAKNIEFRLSKLEKGPDKNVLAIMEIRSRAIAGTVLNQVRNQVLKGQ